MLRSGEILDIRDMYAEGVSITEIARRTERDPKTIRKWIRSEQLPRPQKRKRPSILDPFKDFIVAQMHRGVTNAERMLRDLRKRGYAGQVRIVRTFMQPLRHLVEAAVTMRFETEPGKQAQVDWADFGYLLVNGVQHRLYCFVMVLSYMTSFARSRSGEIRLSSAVKLIVAGSRCPLSTSQWRLPVGWAWLADTAGSA